MKENSVRDTLRVLDKTWTAVNLHIVKKTFIEGTVKARGPPLSFGHAIFGTDDYYPTVVTS